MYKFIILFLVRLSEYLILVALKLIAVILGILVKVVETLQTNNS